MTVSYTHLKGEVVALIDHHGICLDVELVADLGERINIVVHGINQLLQMCIRDRPAEFWL